MHGLGKNRVRGQGKLIFRQGALLLTLRHQIEGGVVMVFSSLSVILGSHEIPRGKRILAGWRNSRQSSVFSHQHTREAFQGDFDD